jgi:hypothetical protein
MWEYFYHSPTPWRYGARPSENTTGLRNWISDDIGNIVVENVGHIDGPYIVQAVNSYASHTSALAEKDAEIARLREALRLIAEGHFVRSVNDRFVLIENPEHRPDDGSDPFIAIDTATT